MTARKHRPTPGLFDAEAILERVQQYDHVHWRIDALVTWDRFLPVLKEVFIRPAKGPGDRPRYPLLMMFKVLVLKHLYNIPDGQLEQRLVGDMFFRRFLDLRRSDAGREDDLGVPGYAFPCGCDPRSLRGLQRAPRRTRCERKEGRIVDASIVPVPVQRITKEERATLEKGETPAAWTEKPSVARQRDTDAAWTKKHKKSYFGYKNHVKMDGGSKTICTFEVTPANEHDSQVVGILLDAEDDAGQELYADAAYAGAPIRRLLRREKMKDRRHRKATKTRPLSPYLQRTNREKSRVRTRVEHVFGALRMKMGDLYVRSIGLVRVTFVIGMRNLLYNMCRIDTIQRMRESTA